MLFISCPQDTILKSSTVPQGAGRPRAGRRRSVMMHRGCTRVRPAICRPAYFKIIFILGFVLLYDTPLLQAMRPRIVMVDFTTLDIHD